MLHGRGRHAQPPGHVRLGGVAVEQALERVRLLQRREVTALHVLHEHELKLLTLADGAGDGGHLGEPRLPRRGQPAMAGHDDPVGSDEEGLQDAPCADRGGQRLDVRGVDVATRVERIRPQGGQRPECERVAGRVGGARRVGRAGDRCGVHAMHSL